MKNNQQTAPMEPGTGQPLAANPPGRVYCKKDLIELYGISYKTLSLWLAPFASEIGPIYGRFFTVAQVRIIFEKIGYPESFE